MAEWADEDEDEDESEDEDDFKGEPGSRARCPTHVELGTQEFRKLSQETGGRRQEAGDGRQNP